MSHESADDQGFDRSSELPAGTVAGDILDHPRVQFVADENAGDTGALVIWLKDEVLVHPAANTDAIRPFADPIGTLGGHELDSEEAANDIAVWKIKPQLETDDPAMDARRLSHDFGHEVEGLTLGDDPLYSITPNHVAVVSHYNTCPWGPPRSPGNAPTLTFLPLAANPVSVVLIDTGFIDEHPDLRPRVVPVPGKWMDDQGMPRDSGPDAKTFPGSPKLNELAGHGTFSAGLIAESPSQARITVVGHRHEVMHVPATPGTPDAKRLFTSEVAVARSVQDHLGEADVLCCQFAFPTLNDHPSLAIWKALDNLNDNRRVVVAPAGNEDTTAKYWPAAHPNVVGVAATDSTGAKADFSNWGDWLKCCARGADVVSSYVHWTGDVEWPHQDPVGPFNGWAKWNGTCFAAAQVAAKIANQYAGNRSGTPAAVWADILAAASGNKVPGGNGRGELPHVVVP